MPDSTPINFDDLVKGAKTIVRQSRVRPRSHILWDAAREQVDGFDRTQLLALLTTTSGKSPSEQVLRESFRPRRLRTEEDVLRCMVMARVVRELMKWVRKKHTGLLGRNERLEEDGTMPDLDL